MHSAPILLRFWAGLLTIHALQEKATLCHLAYAPTRARDVETLPNKPRLQLKRSLEAASRAEGDMSDAPCGRRLLCIWRMALEVRMFFRAFKLNRLKRKRKMKANEKVWEAYCIPTTNLTRIKWIWSSTKIEVWKAFFNPGFTMCLYLIHSLVWREAVYWNHWTLSFVEAGKSIRSKAASKAAGWAVAEEVLAAQVAKCRGKLRGFRWSVGGWLVFKKIGGVS